MNTYEEDEEDSGKITRLALEMDGYMAPSKYGDYVSYEDHCDIVDKLLKEMADLRAERD